MDILSGLSGLKTAADLTKALRDGLKTGQIKGDEIAGRIGEIYDYIVDSKGALVDAKDQIQELKGQLSTLNDHKHIDGELEHDGYVYWRHHPDGTWSGPYCSFCWTKEDKLVPLTHIPGTFGPRSSKRYDCHSHGSFLIPTADSPKASDRGSSRGPGGPQGWMG